MSYKKIEATEIEGGLRLLPDEEIELAFEAGSSYIYFTNKRVITLMLERYQIAPYKDIIYYRIGKGVMWVLGKHRDGITINLPGESSESKLNLAIDPKYYIDVEYLLARHVLKYS